MYFREETQPAPIDKISEFISGNIPKYTLTGSFDKSYGLVRFLS